MQGCDHRRMHGQREKETLLRIEDRIQVGKHRVVIEFAAATPARPPVFSTGGGLPPSSRTSPSCCPFPLNEARLLLLREKNGTQSTTFEAVDTEAVRYLLNNICLN